jgi:alpha-glucosidase
MLLDQEHPSFPLKQAWWRCGAIYEIAPISFQDSDGDGRGDLKGLLQRLDYLEWLGIAAVWLTPIYPSPMRDFGYDISDFCAIDPAYGTMADFDVLLENLHARRIRLILDLVPNHTSDQHSWFSASRADRHNTKRDWYIWADAASNGGPPNNWLSRFGGSAWTWEAQRQQYYYHSFLLEQPDLNWRNREVRLAMFDVMRFWLRKGVDGFRVDASAVLIKDDLLRDNPKRPGRLDDVPPPQHFTPTFNDDRKEAMTCLEEMRAVVDEFDGRVLAGEVQGKVDRIGHFYGDDAKPRFHLPLNFALLDSEWDTITLQATIDSYLKALPETAWPDWVIGGHDKHRIASRIGQPQARILAMLLMTLPGTPFLFAGDEIGMERVRIPPEQIVDPFEKLVPGFGLNRDPERSPMRWDSSAHSGFTSGEPWLPMEAPSARNVLSQRNDETSLLQLYRALIALRQKEPALTLGCYRPLRSTNDILVFERTLDGTTLLIALNMVHEPRKLANDRQWKLLLSTGLDRQAVDIDGSVFLRADEGVILQQS